MNNLEAILEMWKKDSEIDEMNLDDSSRATAKLHSKYLELYSINKLKLKKLDLELKVILRDKFNHYNGKLSQEELNEKGWKFDPYDGHNITIVDTEADRLQKASSHIDLKTVEGDKKYKIRTLPTVWGLLKTKEFLKWLSIITAFIIIIIAVTKFKTNLTALSYAFIFIIGPLFLLNVWVYKSQHSIDYERISKLNKFIIFACIMSMLFLI